MRKHTALKPARVEARAIAVSLFVVLLLSLTSFGQTTQTQNPDSQAAPALTAEDLAAFLDGVVPVQLRRDDIAGAVVAVVKDGRMLFARGYGYPDVEAKKPVSPDATLFRPASISKLFTCTAVMQLVEQGRLDLDADVNQYLDFQIPGTFPTPITLRNLMTHTAGFQESIRGRRFPEGGQLLALKEYLPANLPPRIFAPGTTPAYSNYSNALAGYIVERVSGQSFEDYVDEHIFQPLGMNHSTYAQPLPDSLKPITSAGYLNGSEPARPFEMIQTFPGGGLSATAEDMARFMIAHLQKGSLERKRILREETARLMHSRQTDLVPSMNGSAIGFAEQIRNGYRAIGHGGDLQAFHSQLFLVPELGLGFFISQNSRGRSGPELRTTVWRSFFDRYFPRVSASDQAPADPVTDTHELLGYYKTTRRFDFSIFKLGSLFGQVWVKSNDDGTISSDLVGEYGQPKKLREVEPMKYCEEKGQDCIAFRRDERGRMQIVGAFPHAVFQRVPWYETRPLNLTVLISSVAIFGLTLLLWPISALIRRYYGRGLNLSPSQRRLRLLVRIVCALDLAFIIGGRALFVKLPDPDLEIWVHLLQVGGIIAAAAGLVAVYDAVRCWSDGERRWFSRLHSAGVALACVGFVWFALIWHVFDFSNRY